MYKNLYDAEMNTKLRILEIDIKNRKKLFEFGITKGQVVEKKYVSFDKNMCAIKIDGTFIGMKADICRKIFVEEGDVFE